MGNCNHRRPHTPAPGEPAAHIAMSVAPEDVDAVLAEHRGDTVMCRAELSIDSTALDGDGGIHFMAMPHPGITDPTMIDMQLLILACYIIENVATRHTGLVKTKLESAADRVGSAGDDLAMTLKGAT